MTVLKLYLVLSVFALAAYGIKWDELVVKFSPIGVLGKLFNDAFFTLPTTKDAVKSQGWMEALSDSEYWTVWCLPNDPRVCVLLDLRGNVAGLDVGLPPADMSNTPYDITQHPVLKTVTRFNQTINRGRIFLVSQEVLKSGGRANMSEGLGTGLWVQDGSSVTEFPTAESKIQSETLFTKQNCVPAMGRHYYYNMTKKLECPLFEPYFLLIDVHTNEVHGIGFQQFGHASHKDRKWFELIPSVAVKPTVPESPECLTDWAEEYGIISLHIYFRSKPWNIDCISWL